MRTDAYRKSIYARFAAQARAAGLEWIVLHGIEGYPESIGRDLDAVCIDREATQRACALFEGAAQEQPDTLAVVYPNPLWGKRVLAISRRYEVAELHILYRINSGVISCRPDFAGKKYLGDFPYEENAAEFKAVVMPLLGNSPKVLARMEAAGVERYSAALQSAYRHLKAGGRITGLDRLRIYLQYMGSPCQALESIRYSLRVKRKQVRCATAPLVEFESYSDAAFERLRDKLSEVFTDFRCGDRMSAGQMSRHLARQELVYLTKPGGDYPGKRIAVDLRDEAAAAAIVEAFCAFNLGNKTAYFDGR